ncbi:hypothetical protein GCM10023231_33850 [Olivibacter ginsenosidimutans]|uniref:Uncharacterized protein n=1 Tax=Olivibacter ginsenosidimutans TaxID=1176537 RepID=A0ABP9C2K2_9SPHI
MGIINQGINGSFRGKAGSVIGSGWKKIDYIKGRPRRYKNKGNPSAAQSLQQKKFTLLNQFFKPVSHILTIGFGSALQKSTARNAAFRYNYDHAFLFAGEEPSLNYSALKFSHGSLFPPGQEKAVMLNGEIKITWNTKTYGLSGGLDDEVHIILYIPSIDQFVLVRPTALRYSGEASFAMENFGEKGELIHLWMFLCDSQRKRVSPTVYLAVQHD